MNCENVWQAVYTAGVVLPRPVSECRHLDEELLQNGTCYGFRFYSGKVMDGDGLLVVMMMMMMMMMMMVMVMVMMVMEFGLASGLKKLCSFARANPDLRGDYCNSTVLQDDLRPSCSSGLKVMEIICTIFQSVRQCHYF